MAVAIAKFVPQIFWQAPQMLPLAIAAGVILLLAVVWFYPAQLRLISWPWRGLLPLLRTAALLVLAVSLLKPVALRIAAGAERGELLVLVDRSRSMSVTDNTRTETQLVALADALGRLRPGVRSGAAAALASEVERLRTLAADVQEAQDDLEFAFISGRDVDGRRSHVKEAVASYTSAAEAVVQKASAVQDDPALFEQFAPLREIPGLEAVDAWKTVVRARIDHASSAAERHQATADKNLYASDPTVHQACDAVAKLSRYELVQEQVLHANSGVVARVSKQMPVTLAALADRPAAVPLVEGGKAIEKFPMHADGHDSDLTGGVAAAVLGRPVRAVVLFSDGRQVGGDPRTVSGLAPAGIPIYTVNVAPSAPPRDVSFGNLFFPTGAFIGDVVTIRAEVRHEGFEAGAAEVHLKFGDLPEQVRPIEFHGPQPVSVEFPPIELKKEQAGVQRMAMWFPHVNGEATDDNNRLERSLKVMPEGLRVAVWAGTPGWDFQYVRNLLARRSEVRLQEAVFDSATPKLAMSAQQILQQDMIILFDVPIAALDTLQWDAVSRLVLERGGSVIMVAGDAHLPSEYSSLIATSTLLPFSAQLKPQFRTWLGEQPMFRFVPEPDALSLDVLKLSNDAGGAPRRWEELPPAFRFLQLPEIKAGKLKPGTQALLVEADSRSPVLLERRVGAGRSFFFCLNETWRWRAKVGERDQDRFWRQLVHYASQEPYFANAGPISLDADRVAARPGESVHVRARILDDENAASAQKVDACELQILQSGKKIATRKLVGSGVPGSGRYEGVVALQAGDYELAMTGPHGDTARVPLHVAPSFEAEMANLSGDDALLRQIAELSGGEHFSIEQAARLPDRLATLDDTRSRFAEFRIWDGPYLFCFVLACLAAEWAGRKRVGLA